MSSTPISHLKFHDWNNIQFEGKAIALSPSWYNWLTKTQVYFYADKEGKLCYQHVSYYARYFSCFGWYQHLNKNELWDFLKSKNITQGECPNSQQFREILGQKLALDRPPSRKPSDTKPTMLSSKQEQAIQFLNTFNAKIQKLPNETPLMRKNYVKNILKTPLEENSLEKLQAVGKNCSFSWLFPDNTLNNFPFFQQHQTDILTIKGNDRVFTEVVKEFITPLLDQEKNLLISLEDFKKSLEKFKENILEIARQLYDKHFPSIDSSIQLLAESEDLKNYFKDWNDFLNEDRSISKANSPTFFATHPQFTTLIDIYKKIPLELPSDVGPKNTASITDIRQKFSQLGQKISQKCESLQSNRANKKSNRANELLKTELLERFAPSYQPVPTVKELKKDLDENLLLVSFAFQARQLLNKT